ncbi:hypothetical protein [Desertimonas flava]|nr:hypothetical protein [Desertimonas flava]
MSTTESKTPVLIVSDPAGDFDRAGHVASVRALVDDGYRILSF